MILLLVLGIPVCILFVAGFVWIMRRLNELMDKTGTRAEHIILAPFRRFVWFVGVELTKIPCRPCGGLGLQVLLGGAWTIIPEELRDRQIDGSHPRLANTRRCPRCHGVGHRWVRMVS